MLDTRVVELAVQYLDQCAAVGQAATIVGMHWHIDGRNKTMPLLSEVNEALRQRPQLRVTRQNGIVVFSTQGSETTVTAEDMRQADKQYRAEFASDLRKLKT
jgi:hypothetical protein